MAKLLAGDDMMRDNPDEWRCQAPNSKGRRCGSRAIHMKVMPASVAGFIPGLAVNVCWWHYGWARAEGKIK